MLHEKVISIAQPERVTVEHLPDGGRRIVLAAGAEEFENEDGSGWCYSQADFLLPADRTETREDIAAAFNEWWQYAVAYDPTTPAPSLEERVNDLESAVLALLEM